MKKLLIAAICVMIISQLSAQTIVSTETQKKEVLIEELTGILCPNCPEGAYVVHELMKDYPGRVHTISVHSGYYAETSPDLTNEFMDTIKSIINSSGYPTAGVNRRYFDNSFGIYSWSYYPSIAIGRQYFKEAAEIILEEDSYVNIAASATVDHTSREVTVNVEIYYTGDSPEAINNLNVGILQNNIIGPQYNGSSFPEMYLGGGNYLHQHLLRHMFTGLTGEEITTTTSGSYIERTYSFVLPDDYNGVDVDLDELEILAFITEQSDFREIANVTKTIPVSTDYSIQNDGAVVYITDHVLGCDDYITPKIMIKNFGINNLNSLEIVYNVDDSGDLTYHWTGDLRTFEKELVVLDPISYSGAATNVLNISVQNPNGEADEITDNGISSQEFEIAESAAQVYLEMNTDAHANRGTLWYWLFDNTTGDTIVSERPDQSNTYYVDTFNLIDQHCYTFKIYEGHGNGFSSSGSYYKLWADGDLLEYSTEFGVQEFTDFYADFSTEINDIETKGINIYPNPTSGQVNIECSENSDVLVYNMLGELIFSAESVGELFSLDLKGCNNGVYLVKVYQSGSCKTRKIILNR